MLIDEVDITLKAGHGGPGKSSFNGSGPDGGNGGRGGDIVISVTSDLRALNQFSAENEIEAADGESGFKNRSSGRAGKDTEIFLPVGSVLTDQESGEVIELTNLSQRLVICHGGKGGLGNFEFKSSKNRSPKYAQPGLAGDLRKFNVLLKYLADFGLIGLPNAGKSSLLNQLTNANAKVGAYPFTTLEANLGVLDQKVIADIPGLIAGASHGSGLGIKFLKHVEKVRLLLHCIAADSVDVVGDYRTIIQELGSFSQSLLAKPQIILLTKVDLVDREQVSRQQAALAQFHLPIHEVSIYNSDSITHLKQLLV